MDIKECLEILRDGESGVLAWNRMKRSGAFAPKRDLAEEKRALDYLNQMLSNARPNEDGIVMVELGKPEDRGISSEALANALNSANITESDPNPLNIGSADLSGLNLSGVDMSSCNLAGANFSGSVLRDSNFSRANLTCVNFRGCDLSNANFFSAYLSSANLSDTVLRKASFHRANLRDADFKRADLTEADLVLARLLRCDMSNAIVERASVAFIQVQDLASAPTVPTVLYRQGDERLSTDDALGVFKLSWKTHLSPCRIFISYRRKDFSALCVRLYEALCDRYGRELIFIDQEVIPLGIEDFERFIMDSIGRTTTVLVAVGSQWLGLGDQSSNGIQSPDDYVRKEIERAFQVEATIIPVLLDNARMPTDALLPVSLKPLVKHNAIRIAKHSFDNGFDKLCAHLEGALGLKPVSSRALRPRRTNKKWWQFWKKH